jgi:hypothetical protein
MSRHELERILLELLIAHRREEPVTTAEAMREVALVKKFAGEIIIKSGLRPTPNEED